MAQRQFPTLTKRTVDRLSVNDKDTVFWDRDLPGFGVRVYPSGKKVFVVQTRAFGRSKRVSLGEHGDTDFSVDDARRKATEIITRIKTGLPPVPPEPAPAPTVADLADLAERYQREYVEMHCKPLTINHYRLMLRKHIEPALGERLVADVEYKDILAIHNSGLPPVPPEPAPAPTVADLADLAERYQREYVEMHCKPLTINHYRLMLRKHIEPALGERLVADVEYKDILAIHNSLHHMPTVANRAADILVKMFNLADGVGVLPAATHAGACPASGSRSTSGSSPARSSFGSARRSRRRQPSVSPRPMRRRPCVS